MYYLFVCGLIMVVAKPRSRPMEKGPPMIIDGHAHVVLPAEHHIEMMDEAGVDKTVLFSTLIHPEQADGAQGLKEEMQKLNDIISGKGDAAGSRALSIQELQDSISRYPGRFIGFAPVPVGLGYPETLHYVENLFADYCYAGFGEFTLASGQIGLLEPVFMASSDMGRLPIWVHAFNPLVLSDIEEVAGLARSYPGVPVILGHLGGSNWLESLGLARGIPNLYLDISAWFSALVLKIVINELPDKCLFGTDLPYGDLQIDKDAVTKLAGSPAVAHAVLGENMARLLKL